MISEKIRTIVSRTFEDGSIMHFYADLEIKDGVAEFTIVSTNPLSDDEVSEFNKNKKKLGSQ